MVKVIFSRHPTMFLYRREGNVFRKSFKMSAAIRVSEPNFEMLSYGSNSVFQF